MPDIAAEIAPGITMYEFLYGNLSEKILFGQNSDTHWSFFYPHEKAAHVYQCEA